MTRALWLLVLVAASCRPTDLESCSQYLETNQRDIAEGLLLVEFDESVVSTDAATRVIEQAGLLINHFYSAEVPLTAQVLVPQGAECISIERLRANPAINGAFLNLLVFAQ